MIPIKTRAEIYGREATELLRFVSIYPGLSENQLCRFYPGKEDKTINLLSHLKRQGRVTLSDTGLYFPAGVPDLNADSGLTRAVWILLDYIDRVEYHSSSDFPVKIIFFLAGGLYEIVYAAMGQEALVNHIMGQNGKNDSRRIVLVDAPNQIQRLDFPGISGFCTVKVSGKVNYYKKTNGGL